MADLLTLKSKTQALIDFSKSLNYRQKIVYSDQGNLLDRSYIQQYLQSGRASFKPSGLWYSYGPAWITWLTNDYKLSLDYDFKEDVLSWEMRRLHGYTHVYQIFLNRKKNIQSS